jgi:hypothetical protein
MDSNFQYASTVRLHHATDLALPPTVKRRSGAPASHTPSPEILFAPTSVRGNQPMSSLKTSKSYCEEYAPSKTARYTEAIMSGTLGG